MSRDGQLGSQNKNNSAGSPLESMETVFVDALDGVFPIAANQDRPIFPEMNVVESGECHQGRKSQSTEKNAPSFQFLLRAKGLNPKSPKAP